MDARQFTPPPGYRGVMRVFYAIKRTKMYNIMFHGLHTANNVLTGPGQPWDILGMYRVARGIAAGNIGLMRAGIQGPMRFVDPKEQELALRLARGGVNFNVHDELSKRIDDHLREFQPEADRAFSWLFSGAGKAWSLHEDPLWKGIVRASAYDLAKKWYTIFTKAGVGPDDAARLTAGVVNSRSGLLNPETLSETSKIVGNISLYARNWTLSNPRMFRGAAFGKYGHTPIYSPKERAMLQNEDLKTMGRSLFYLYGVPNLINYWVDGVPMWKNPEGYQLSMAFWKQVDPQTGKTTVYYVKPMAFMQDIVHIHGLKHVPGIRAVTKGEPGILETLGNKESPVLSAIHTAIRGTKKFPPGEPLWATEVVTGPDGKPIYKDGKVQFKTDVLGGLAEIAREAALPSDLGWLSAQGRSKLTSLPYKPSEREPELSPWQKAVLSKLKGHSPEWIQRYLAHTSPIPPMPAMPLYGGAPLAAWAYGSTPRARTPLGAYVQEKGKRREMIGALREMQVERARERRPKVPGSIDALLGGGEPPDTVNGLTEEQKRILRKYGVR
jgi:hypothetical protein